MIKNSSSRGPIHPCIVIAEAGVNHNGDVLIAEKLIERAAWAGADYVKFQTFKTGSVIAKTAPKAEYQLNRTNELETQFEMVHKLELSFAEHHRLVELCRSHGIGFLSSPFDLASLEFLQSLDLDFMKIASGELTNRIMLEAIGRGKEAIILSTGMAYQYEIGEALEVLYEQGRVKEDVIVLQCNTEYPTPLEDVNIRGMLSIKEAWDVQVGFSDHSLGIAAPIAAVALGAIVVEKHITLDNTMEGPDHAASMEPEEFKIMVNHIRAVELALGSDIKKPSPSEEKNIEIARRSIYYNKDLLANQVVSLSDIIMLRPGTGISPMDYQNYLGKKLTRNVDANTQLRKADFE